MKMKLIIIIASLVIAIASKAQPMAALEIGASVTNSTAMIGFQAGYNWKLLNISAGAQVHVSSSIFKGAALEIKAGHEISVLDGWYVTPGFGYSYHYNSDQLKSLNVNTTLYAAEIAKSIRYEQDDRVRLYLSYTKSGEWHFIALGVKGIF